MDPVDPRITTFLVDLASRAGGAAAPAVMS
jgi:hypothetical protein